MSLIGIDITRISRFDNPNDSLVKRILHPNELALYPDSENKALFLASRWAIKEALFKSDNSLSSFDKIELTKKDRIWKYKDYKITTSKEDDYFIAFVQKEK